MLKKLIILIIFILIAAVGVWYFVVKNNDAPVAQKQKTQNLQTQQSQGTREELIKVCSIFSRDKAEIHQPTKPFAANSIWNRTVPENAVYSDVQDAIFGDSESAPGSVGVDIVTLCYSDISQPFTNIEQNTDWEYPGRSKSAGKVLYKRNLSPTACGCVNWKRDGNNLFVLINPIKNLADIGVGGWRIFNGPLLNLPNDSAGAHNIDVVNGDGIFNKDGVKGYGRGSGLPAIGGLIRPGEFENGISHAVGIALPASRFSSKKNFIWPAQSADSYAKIGYWGNNQNYTMGTLLAIPYSTDISKMTWKTMQGLNLAKAAQKYGLYIVDASGYKGNWFGLAIEDEAARFDLGYDITYVGASKVGQQSVDPAKIDAEGFNADMVQILKNVSAVVSNVK